MNSNKFRFISQTSLSLFLVLLLSNCSSITTPENDGSGNKLQCMRYFIYEMCALDFNQDDKVDFIYFDDTKEAFMRRPDLSESEIKALGYPIHPCIQVLNEPTQAASDRFLAIDKTTKYRERSRIKGDLIDNYSNYSATVKACNDARDKQKDMQEELINDDFGEEDFENLE